MQVKFVPVMRRSIPALMTLVVLAAISHARSAQATVVESDLPTSTTSEFVFPASASDLIDQNQTSTFSSQTNSGFTNGFGSGGPTQLNDGTLGSGNNLPTTTISLTDWTTTFHLNTSINTQGYDLTGINTIAAWPDNRVDQQYQVFYSTVSSNPGGTDNTGFSLLKSVSYIPHPGGNTNSASSTGGNATEVQLAITGVTGVNAIQFQIVAIPVSGVGGDVETVYREFDAFGAASVPEPGSVILIAFGAIGLLAAAYRKS